MDPMHITLRGPFTEQVEADCGSLTISIDQLLVLTSSGESRFREGGDDLPGVVQRWSQTLLNHLFTHRLSRAN